MSKKTWILIACLVLSLTLGLGTSLAYLTDTSTKINTFTMGNVDIEVEENFVKDSELKPGLKVTKEAKIVNTGNNPAYVWMTVAVPADMDEYITLEWPNPIVVDDEDVADYSRLGFTPEGKLDMAMEGDFSWYYVARGEDGKEYHVYAIIWWPVLQPNESTENLLLSVTLSEHVDCIDGVYYFVQNGQKTEIPDPNDLKIIVTGYAIQKDGFADPIEAYNAYGSQWGELVVKTSENVTENADQEIITDPEDNQPEVDEEKEDVDNESAEDAPVI